jgi:hypothetical protein
LVLRFFFLQMPARQVRCRKESKIKDRRGVSLHLHLAGPYLEHMNFSAGLSTPGPGTSLLVVSWNLDCLHDRHHASRKTSRMPTKLSKEIRLLGQTCTDTVIYCFPCSGRGLNHIGAKILATSH